jgi:hypothetical protein
MHTRFLLLGGAILLLLLAGCTGLSPTRAPLELSSAAPAGEGDFVLCDGTNAVSIFVEPTEDRAVTRAAGDLAEDVLRVTGVKPALATNGAAEKQLIIIGTLGRSRAIDRLAAEGKLDVTGVRGQWESYVLQVVAHPLPGVERALVIAGSDRRGTVYGIYELSERIGVSPWYWWADVPVTRKNLLALRGDLFKQGPPAVKYRGIFLNDEDFGLRPWASKAFDPETGNLGPKTYAKLFELLLRLRANYLWPAMHQGSRPFNFYPANPELADACGIVMGSSHCEQMLRNNVSEWDTNLFGAYNYVTNSPGVLKYWEQRVRENGKFENIYTVGMRGIHDSAMPGGGTEAEQAARLRRIIADQRKLLARQVNPNVTLVPQIFCPYKEALPLYRRMPDLPGDITIVWPDDNFGYVRQFSNGRERRRKGGAGVYYHVSYWGAPRDYLWLCSTPPALIAEEMTKAFAYGADRVWMLNVGDLKPAELDTEFFLRLAWNPPSWNGTNTYELLARQLARDFGPANAPELVSILAEYYRLNFQRKPEHVGFPTNNLFLPDEAVSRVAAWQTLTARVAAAENNLPAEARDAFFELIGYPVRAAALANERMLAPAGAQSARDEIRRLTAAYNHQIAGGKWRGMMSDNPHKMIESQKFAAEPERGAVAGVVTNAATTGTRPQTEVAAEFPGADFVEDNGLVVMEAEHASAFLPGRDARWRKIVGLGYNGEAVSVVPATAPVRSTPEKILSGSPCLQYRIGIHQPGDWTVTVRALPTFSVEAGRAQRYAIAVDDAKPQIISLPAATSEHDRQWQENVLRNAALTASTNTIFRPGAHTLKIWMVDPGIVLDTVFACATNAAGLGCVGPAETKYQPR